MRARAWLAAAVLGFIGVLMLAVFPARTLLAQRSERRHVAARVAALAQRNQGLQARSDLLQTDPEIERLARQHYDLVRPGEVVFDIVGAAPPPVPAVPAARSTASPDPGWGRRMLARLTDVF